MYFLRALLIVFIFFQPASYACDENFECQDCPPESEFSWNPSNIDTSPRLNRFYGMEALATSAYQKGDHNLAKTHVREYLQLASIYRCNWNYGNAIHDSNILLGLMSFDDGDITSSTNYLIAAGLSPGSPQLNSFGPSFGLANKLLKLDEDEAVIDYLLGVQKFWNGNEKTIDDWIQKIKSGEQIELNRYQPSMFETAINLIFLALPLFLTFGFWLKIKQNLVNNWSFPMIAIPAGYISIYLASFLMSPLTMVIIEFVSTEVLSFVLLAAFLVLEAGAPYLAIYLIAGHFKTRNIRIQD